VSTIEELLGSKISGSALESENMAVGDPSRSPRVTLSAEVGTDFADKRRSLDIVRSRTQATELSVF
jgi:hypothetical protein